MTFSGNCDIIEPSKERGALHKRREENKMYRVVKNFDGTEYTHGTYSNRDKANEVALMLRDYDIDAYVIEVE